jgi:TonB family protein
MRLLVFAVILLFGGVIASLQPARHRAFAQGKVNDETEVDEQKRITACESPEQEKPNGETKRVSQLCGHALRLPKPAYPEEAKANGISGTVVVDIVTNEEGRVVWAKATNGPELLWAVSVKAACRARYSPTLVSGRAIRTESSIQYLFKLP